MYNLLKQVGYWVQFYYTQLLFFIVNRLIYSSKMRAKIISFCYKNAKIGKGSTLRKNVTLYGGDRFSGILRIGENVFINEECFLDHSSEIEIRDHVSIGMRTTVLSSSHKIGDPVRCGPAKRKKTLIESNCWIGANVTIYPGISIGRGSVIAAGVVVCENIEANQLVTLDGSTELIVQPRGDGKLQ